MFTSQLSWLKLGPIRQSDKQSHLLLREPPKPWVGLSSGRRLQVGGKHHLHWQRGRTKKETVELSQSLPLLVLPFPSVNRDCNPQCLSVSRGFNWKSRWSISENGNEWHSSWRGFLLALQQTPINKQAGLLDFSRECPRKEIYSWLIGLHGLSWLYFSIERSKSWLNSSRILL